MKRAVQSRLAALRVLERIVQTRQTLMTAFHRLPVYETLPDSDKQFCRLLVLTALRRYGQITAFIQQLVSKPLPAKRQDIHLVLVLGLVQLYYLKTPAHAAVDTSVCLVREIKQPSFAGFVNGVLRSFMRNISRFAEPSVLLNLPKWVYENWLQNYTPEQIQRFVETFMQEAPLDIFVKNNAADWAKKLNGTLLPTGGIRCGFSKDVTQMNGYSNGVWWVQEASASVPAQLFPDVQEKKVADLCAAPGGKTAQLMNRGAFVEAFDISAHRLERLRENMKRLGFEKRVSIRCVDVLTLPDEEKYDCVLLDAPCSATGTVRRHPDLWFHLSKDDILRLAQTQKKLLQKAVRLTKTGGYIVYSTCSLEKEENEAVVEAVLAENKNIARVSLPKRWQSFLNDKGAVQILPTQNQDGFYAVLLEKRIS